MDVQRTDFTARKKRRRNLLIGAALLGLGLVMASLRFLKPSAPTVEKSEVWIDTVKQGTLNVRVRGVGTLTPEDQRWLTARTGGRVEKLVLLPGASLQPGTLLMELSNPELEQELRNAALQLTAAESEFANLEAELEGQLLELKSGLASVEANTKIADLEATVNKELFAEGLVAELTLKQSILRAEQLATQLEIEKQRIASRQNAIEKQLAARRVNVEQEQQRYELVQSQVQQLQVRASDHGILQRVPVVEGTQVSAGQNLAQVANPTRLKAVVRIPETQAKDVQIGLKAVIDTRNGVVEGEVMRIDPTVENGTVNVDLRILGDLPRGARPDLSIEGSIELTSLPNVIYVGRPSFARENGVATIFRLVAASNLAERVSVRFGRSSVTDIVVEEGLQPGDRVILSDTSAWDRFDRLKIN